MNDPNLNCLFCNSDMIPYYGDCLKCSGCDKFDYNPGPNDCMTLYFDNPDCILYLGIRTTWWWLRLNQKGYPEVGEGWNSDELFDLNDLEAVKKTIGALMLFS